MKKLSHIWNNLTCILRLMVVWHIWAYDPWLRTESFAKLKVLKKKKIQHPLPRSTPSATKWEIKIFHEWQATRRNKNCLEEQVGFKFDINKAQDLNYDVADMTVGSFNFWLTKFVEVCKDDVEWYPSRSLYSIRCGIWRHLEDCNWSDAIRILNKNLEIDMPFSQYTKGLSTECCQVPQNKLTIFWQKCQAKYTF